MKSFEQILNDVKNALELLRIQFCVYVFIPKELKLRLLLNDRNKIYKNQ